MQILCEFDENFYFFNNIFLVINRTSFGCNNSITIKLAADIVIYRSSLLVGISATNLFDF